MLINFFEEFPSDETINLAKLITFPSQVFIAAKNYGEFKKWATKLKKINQGVEGSYWPILEKSYWVSPFSYTSELESLFAELGKIKEKTKILIDLELPILNKSLFLKNITQFQTNKRLISNFLNTHHENLDLFAAEYLELGLSRWILKAMGISGEKNKSIVMCYTSMVPKPLKPLARKIALKNKLVGIGVIATGILGDEKVMSPEELSGDLEFFAQNGTKEAFIFRLGGLNRNYIKVIEKYLC